MDKSNRIQFGKNIEEKRVLKFFMTLKINTVPYLMTVNTEWDNHVSNDIYVLDQRKITAIHKYILKLCTFELPVLNIWITIYYMITRTFIVNKSLFPRANFY